MDDFDDQIKKESEENMEATAKTYSIKGGAEYLGLTPKQIEYAISKQYLISEKQNGQRRMTQENLDDYWDKYVAPTLAKQPVKGDAENQTPTATTEEIAMSDETKEATEEYQTVEEVPSVADESEEAPAEVEVEPEMASFVEALPGQSEERPVSEPTPLDKLNEAMKSIVRAESHLKDLGVPLERLDEIIAAMREYERVKETIDFAREQQFLGDALTLLNVFHASGNNVSSAALFLRKFAEHIVTCAANPIDPIDVAELVDNIAPMESEE